MTRFLLSVVAVFSFTANSLAEPTPFLKDATDSIKCVQQGIKDHFKLKDDPSDKWLIFLAASIQENDGPLKLNFRRGKEMEVVEQNRLKFNNRLISMVQTYGFCSSLPRLASPYKAGLGNLGGVLPGIGRFVDGTDATAKMSLNFSKIAERDKDAARNFLELLGLDRKSKKFPDLVKFEHDNPTWFATSIPNRKKDFISKIDKMMADTVEEKITGGWGEESTTTTSTKKSPISDGFKECLAQIKHQNEKNPIFSDSLRNGKEGSTKFCQSMGKACGLDLVAACKPEGSASQGSSDGKANHADPGLFGNGAQ